MPTPTPTIGSPNRFEHDPFNAGVAQVGFVMRRDRPKDWSIINIANPYYDILAFCLDGKCRYQCAEQTIEATRCTMLFFPREVQHSAWTDASDPWSFFSVGFQLNCADAMVRGRLTQLPWHLRMPNWPEITDLFAQLLRHWNQQQPGSSLACRGLMCQLMQQYLRVAVQHSLSVPHTARLEKVIRLMHDHIGKVYSVHELATLADLSDSRFRLLFHQLTGCSVTRYQNRLRIQAAQDLLLSGQYTVTQAAAELGFNDVYYFSRLFKKIVGINPSACMQQ